MYWHFWYRCFSLYAAVLILNTANCLLIICPLWKIFHYIDRDLESGGGMALSSVNMHPIWNNFRMIWSVKAKQIYIWAKFDEFRRRSHFQFLICVLADLTSSIWALASRFKPSRVQFVFWLNFKMAPGDDRQIHCGIQKELWLRFIRFHCHSWVCPL